jgi:hypothetical protein
LEDGLKNEGEVYQIKKIRRRKTMEQSTKYLSQGDFLYDWEQWKNTIDQATKTTGQIGIPLISEETLIRDLWSVATPDERKTLAELLFKLMDKNALESRNQESDEPYGGY